MLQLSRLAAGLTLALAALPLATAEPAHAACIVQGDAYRLINDHPGDPTGPAVYIKAEPDDGFYYFVRLRDGWELFRTLQRQEPVRVQVEGDAPHCPTAGIVRDIGTAVDGVTLLEPAMQIGSKVSSAP